MKKTLLAKVLCFALAMIMLLACLAACGEPAPQQNPGSENGGEGGDNVDEGNKEVLTGEEAEYLPETKDYTARGEFRIHAGAHQAWGLVHYDFLEGVEGDGKAVNDALMERSLLLQGMYGILINLYASIQKKHTKGISASSVPLPTNYWSIPRNDLLSLLQNNKKSLSPTYSTAMYSIAIYIYS